MLTNKQLSELIQKELKFLTAEIFCFSGSVCEPAGSNPDDYRWIRDESVQVRTDRLYWLAKKFPAEYKRHTWNMAELRPNRPEEGPSKKKIRNIRK